MRSFRLIAVPLAAITVVALAGCIPFVSGPMTSEDREIDAVTIVVLDTAGDITISEGEPKLVIHASQAALDRLTSEVNGDTLVLGTKPGPGFGLGEVRYDLTLPALEAIELNGSGDIDATVSAEDAVRLNIDGSGDVSWTGLAAQSVEIRLSGSGDIELAGATQDLRIGLDGSGDIDAADLEAQDVTVAIDGSGNVDVSAQDTLSADVSGSGRVTYTGDPSVSADVSGSGAVVHE